MLHQAAYRQMGHDWQYERRKVDRERLAEVLAELAGPELLGVNLTLPLKEEGLRLASQATAEARQMGAANCLRWSERGWEAHNTDAQGWLDSWDQEIGLSLQGRKAIVLGAGGACRAVLWALRHRQVGSLVLLARNPQRGRALLSPGEALGDFSISALQAELEPGAVVVQTTPVGMWPEVQATPLNWPEHVPADCVACDLIYNPAPTRWLQEASARGMRCLDGRGMLVHQALRGILWWTGQQASSQGLAELLR